MTRDIWKQRLWRAFKFARALILQTFKGINRPSKYVFVMGAQRSGTRLPMVVMERSPDIGTYAEGHSLFFNGVLLKSDDRLTSLLYRTPFPVLALKPICESHRAKQLLDKFPNSQVIWIYRDYRNATHSSVKKWKGGIKEIELLVKGAWKQAGWRAGGLTEDKLFLLRQVYSSNLSLHSAYALKWFLRTGLFFDIGLSHRRDVLLVKYEDLAVNPVDNFKSIFTFIDVKFRTSYVRDVYASSVPIKKLNDVDCKIEELCIELQKKMDHYYEAQFL